jgi:hypothetical protein
MCGQSCFRLPRRYSAGLSTGNRSSLWTLISLLAVLALATLTGCENPLTGIFSREPEVFIPAGKCAEIRKPVDIKVITHDKEGRPVKGYFRAYPGANVGPGIPSYAFPAKESEIK